MKFDLKRFGVWVERDLERRIRQRTEGGGCRGAPSALDKRNWEQSGYRDNSIGLAVVGGDGRSIPELGPQAS